MDLCQSAVPQALLRKNLHAFSGTIVSRAGGAIPPAICVGGLRQLGLSPPGFGTDAPAAGEIWHRTSISTGGKDRRTAGSDGKTIGLVLMIRLNPRSCFGYRGPSHAGLLPLTARSTQLVKLNT